MQKGQALTQVTPGRSWSEQNSEGAGQTHAP